MGRTVVSVLVFCMVYGKHGKWTRIHFMATYLLDSYIQNKPVSQKLTTNFVTMLVRGGFMSSMSQEQVLYYIIITF